MPSYNFKNLTTGETWTEYMSMAACEQLLEDTNIQQMVSSAAIISGKASKPDNGFRDVLKGIKKANIGSKIETY